MKCKPKPDGEPFDFFNQFKALPSLTVQAARRANSVTQPDSTSASTRDNSTDMTPIEAAFAAIESLEPEEQFNHRKFSEVYGCDRTPLTRRHQHQSITRSLEAQNRQALHPQQEVELLQYIKQLT